MRQELFSDINHIEDNGKLFEELHKRIKENLKQGKNVIYDATNINHKRRKAFLDEIKKIGCVNECYLIATPYEICLKQNSERERHVPESVIKEMYKNIFIPQYFEGWNKIHIIKNFNKENFGDVNTLFNGENGLNYINQNNPHHTLTIGEHCRKCMYNTEQLTNGKDNELIMAALFHDIGKAFTKEFKKRKGRAFKYSSLLQSS